jgi:hypothetical protein
VIGNVKMKFFPFCHFSSRRCRSLFLEARDFVEEWRDFDCRAHGEGRIDRRCCPEVLNCRWPWLHTRRCMYSAPFLSPTFFVSCSWRDRRIVVHAVPVV